jgi:hypothetical protein
MEMEYKTLLKLSVPVLSIMLVSACGYIKDIKEKFNPHESPVNARTEESAYPTGEGVNPSDKTAKDNLNNDRSTSGEDDSNSVSGKVQSKDSINSDLNSDKPINKKIPSKEPTNK